MTIISPKCDYCIKELFRNETVRRYFLSDILSIPLNEIRSVRLMNTFLWKKYRNQRLGILDILIELNDSAKINIEMQVSPHSHWDKRQIFYLAKLYTADLRTGEAYKSLRRCVGISILDFNLTEREEYHSVYRLRDEKGNLFSKELEIHTLELKKKLIGKEPADDWIRLFNAESEEDLDMINTKNIGILEAIHEVKLMNLTGRMKARYEAHLKYVRDKKAREEYIEECIEQSLAKGLEQGIEQGLEQGTAEGQSRMSALIRRMTEAGDTGNLPRLSEDAFLKEMFDKYHI